MLSLRWELSTCSKWWTNMMSPNLDVGPWTLNELVNGVGTLLQHGELLLCSRLLIWICKYKVNLGFKLVHHHWHPRRVEDLLDFMHCPCPGVDGKTVSSGGLLHTLPRGLDM